ncbi:MAG: hypothetical protein NUV90_01940 [Candidatus Parcubacteria bacterium]|nr:hypothetical protein [Candidatus Parcubacteria bacterium]
MPNLTREGKEKLYISKMTELQRRWGNPIDDDWNFTDWTDGQLDKGLTDTIGQLRFEKGLSFIKTTISYIFYLFVILGVGGLLIFGIKQLF